MSKQAEALAELGHDHSYHGSGEDIQGFTICLKDDREFSVKLAWKKATFIDDEDESEYEMDVAYLDIELS